MFNRAGLCRLLFILFFVQLAAFSQSSIPENSLPLGSWENWIQQILKGVEVPRPDGLAKMAALPVWVDCHISWWMDQPRSEKSNPQFTVKIPSEIILRATPKICEGQLEQWAH